MNGPKIPRQVKELPRRMAATETAHRCAALAGRVGLQPQLLVLPVPKSEAQSGTSTIFSPEAGAYC